MGITLVLLSVLAVSLTSGLMRPDPINSCLCTGESVRASWLIAAVAARIACARFRVSGLGIRD